jgi:hypothetical protein
MATEIEFGLPQDKVRGSIRRLLCAGYTGRSRADVEAHIAELAPLGIGPPPHVPMLFPIIPELLSQSVETSVLGVHTAPEVEYVIFRLHGHDYVTVGSDQTDSVMEGQHAPTAKNLCLKSVATEAWPVGDVASHWDRLELKLTCNGKVMQEGTVASMLTPEQLRAFVSEHDGPDHEGRMIFSGTLETHGRFPESEMSIKISLNDPVRKRAISHSYKVSPMKEFFPAKSN